MKYIVDIDGTIFNTEGNDYENSTPILERIAYINSLFDQGHEIHYWTARGSSSGKDHLALTLKQLKQWDCKYTTANVGKPVYDIWIDDKAHNDKSYFDNVLNNKITAIEIIKFMKKLRNEGYAVIIWTPEELKNMDNMKMERLSIEYGSDLISMN